MLLNIFLSVLLAIGTVAAVFLLTVVWNKLYDKLTSYFIAKGACIYDAKEQATGSIAMVLLVVALTSMFYILLSN